MWTLLLLQCEALRTCRSGFSDRNSRVPYQRWAESHFSDSDSAPAQCFKTLAPTPKSFETSTPTPVCTLKTSKYLILKRYCLFCLRRQNISRGYCAFDRTHMVEMVTWLAQYRETQHVEVWSYGLAYSLHIVDKYSH